MRKIVLGLAVSLDGFIEGPNGEYDWCFTDQDYGLNDFMKNIDAIVMGRKSYDLVKTMEGSNPWEGMKTYVVSNTLRSVTDPNVEIISGDFIATIHAMRNEPGKDIWLFGGAQLTTTCINHQVIDEYWLSVHPILLGKGKPLFQNLDGRQKLKLTENKTYSSGLVSLRYEPDRNY